MNYDDLVDNQKAAIDEVLHWFKNKPEQKVFKLFGPAGTGKTTLARIIGDTIGNVLYVAFTGKAALVLAGKGCQPASTIHSAVYKSHQDEDTGQWYRQVDFDSEAGLADLVIIDEGPMVGASLANDALQVFKRVLVLGDPFQLPPVSDVGYWTDDPDFTLTDIHRQAADNPIIQMSMIVRNGGVLKYGKYGDSQVVKAKQYDPAMMLDHSQTLCGKNDTRYMLNHDYRKVTGLFKEHGFVPTKGERLICLRNENERGFLNGSMWEVQKAKLEEGLVTALVSPLDFNTPTADFEEINTPLEYYEGLENTLDWRIRKSSNEFVYAYAITTHKAQGSQFENVLILDQSRAFREDRFRWLYTAITRAERQVTILM